MENNVLEVINNKRSNKPALIIIAILILLFAGIFCYRYFFQKESSNLEEGKVNTKIFLSPMAGNSLGDFDLSFLKLENGKENKIYSPLSIKYALEMLKEGTKGESKEQISQIIGDYTPKKYANSENMFLANALFIKNSYKDSVRSTYTNLLLNKYNAEVIYDSFTSANSINSWVSNKTFNLVNNLVEDVSDDDFILVNALGIDMELVNKIQSETEAYYVYYDHEKFEKQVAPLDIIDYHPLDFYNVSKQVKSVEIAAVANKYDIVSTIGEDNIRATVTKAYEDWLTNDYDYNCDTIKEYSSFDAYLDAYIQEINKGYKDVSDSTDFYFYTDDDIKVFAKDLKTYNGTTLQYVAIMPAEELNSYIKNITAANINTLIQNLKSVELNSFKEGVITHIFGYIPMFKFDYELNLKSDLQSLGITDIFSSKRANLYNITKDKAYITKTLHKSNIEFSNEGITAAAATEVMINGDADCGFDYKYEVPIEEIDLTFNKPYLFIIRDKETNEIWFVGTVYNPIDDYEFQCPDC